jgi:dihydroneopterin aldolase
MDCISLSGIDVYAHHGVLPAERELGQRFIIDVQLFADCSRAALEDDLGHALDYSRAHQLICEATAATSFRLIEALAGHLCAVLLENLPLERVVLTVQKPNPPIANFLGRAAVTLDRDRSWIDLAARQKD